MRTTGSLRLRHAAWALAALALACGGDGTSPGGTDVAAVQVTPPSARIVVGTSIPFSAVARDAGGAALSGRTVFWSSRDQSIATVSQNGTVTGVATGTTQIAATVEGKSAAADIEIIQPPVNAVRITPAEPRLYVGQRIPLAAQPLDAAGGPLSGRTATWSSSDAAVATVDGSGVLTAVAPGAATVTATVEGRSAVAAVTVEIVPVKTVAVAPSLDTIVIGQSTQLAATPRDSAGGLLAGRDVSWESSSPETASVSSTGLVVAFAPGTATITARSGAASGTARVVVRTIPVGAVIVSPSTTTLAVGATVQLASQVTDASGGILLGRTVAYESSDPSVATVSPTGLVTGVAVGTATITGRSEGKVGTTEVGVVPIAVATVDIEPDGAAVVAGQTVQLTAQPLSAAGEVLPGRSIGWSSSAPSIATVAPDGLVTGVAPGAAIIAAVSEGKTGVITVTVQRPPVRTVAVTPSAPSVDVNGGVQLSATVTDVTGAIVRDLPVAWSSSAPAIAVVSSSGRVVGLARGTATITATAAGISGTATVTVR